MPNSFEVANFPAVFGFALYTDLHGGREVDLDDPYGSLYIDVNEFVISQTEKEFLDEYL